MLPHFYNPICAYSHPYNIHQKCVSLLQSIFTSLSHSYLFAKSSIRTPLTLPFCTPQQFSTSPCLRTTIPAIRTRNSYPTAPEIVSLPQPFSQINLRHKDQGARESCDDRHCLDLFFLRQSMDTDNRAHNH